MSLLIAALSGLVLTQNVETPEPIGTISPRTPTVGEIAYFAFPYCPRTYWMRADGSTLPLNNRSGPDYTLLFSLIGTTYGGDGRTNFVIPDLRGRVGVHRGIGPQNRTIALGERAGQEETTLTVGTMPSHSHQLLASPGGPDTDSPAQANLATFPVGLNRYARVTPNTHLSPLSISTEPEQDPEALENRTPVMPMTACIAFQGNYPNRPNPPGEEPAPVAPEAAEPVQEVEEEPGRIRGFFRRLRFWDREDG